MKKTLTVLLILLCTISLVACGTQGNSNQSSSENIKEEEKTMAEQFEMNDLDGNVVKLSDFEGKNVYIKYWASWCSICLSGLEDINTLSAEQKDFEVITIVAPDYQGEKSSEDFIEWFSGVENTNNIKVLLDTDGKYTKSLGVRGYPTSEWIGTDGSVLKLSPGHVENSAIAQVFSQNDNQQTD